MLLLHTFVAVTLVSDFAGLKHFVGNLDVP